MSMVWHCGDPLGEQRAMERGRGIAPLDRDVISVAGADRLSFLHSLTTTSVMGLEPGRGVTTLVLSPTGRIEHVLHGVDDGEAFLAWTEPGAGEPLTAWLNSMRFMLDIDARVRDDLQVVWVGEAEGPIDAVAERASEVGKGRELFVRADADLPATTAGEWAFEAMRIAAGVPRIGIDTDDVTLPNELGLYATEVNKGCYRGQEAVAHVHNLGRPPRRLVRLLLDGDEERLPGPGTSITLDEVEIGKVTSAAYHHELGGIALGLIKRATPVGATLLADGIPAGQDAIVDPEIGDHFKADRGLRSLL